jgi:hypothetical protein
MENEICEERIYFRGPGLRVVASRRVNREGWWLKIKHSDSSGSPQFDEKCAANLAAILTYAAQELAYDMKNPGTRHDADETGDVSDE